MNTYWLSAVVVVVLCVSDASAMRGCLVNARLGRLLQQSHRAYKLQQHPLVPNLGDTNEMGYKANLQYPFNEIYKQAIDKARQEVVNQGHCGVDRYDKTYAAVKDAVASDLSCLKLLIDDQSLMMSGEELVDIIVQLEKDACGGTAYYPANVTTFCAREFYSMIVKHDNVNDFFEKNMSTIVDRLNHLQVNKIVRSPYFKPFFEQVRYR